MIDGSIRKVEVRGDTVCITTRKGVTEYTLLQLLTEVAYRDFRRIRGSILKHQTVTAPTPPECTGHVLQQAIPGIGKRYTV